MTMPPDSETAPALSTEDIAQAPCLVIHSNVLVAEDLCDILIGEGAPDVLTAKDVSDAPLLPARLVVVAEAFEILMSTPQAIFWQQHGIPIILLGGIQHQARAEMAGLHVLQEPFRTEDVTKLLNHLGIF